MNEKGFLTIWLVGILLFMAVGLASIEVISIYQKYYIERGSPLHIFDLEKGKTYTRPDEHNNIVLFIDEEGIDRVAYLPEDCPQRFHVIDDNGTLRIVPIPLKEK